MDYTARFISFRNRVATQARSQQQNDQEWVGRANEIRKMLDTIGFKQEELEQRVKKSQTLVYREAANQAIMGTRFEIKMNIQKVNTMIKQFKEMKGDAKDQEFSSYHQSLVNSFAARSTFLGSNFKDQSARFMDDIVKQVSQAENMQRQHVMSDAEKIYKQAQEEMKLIIDEVSQLVDMINELVGSIYECGTILNRVESYMTEAEQAVENAVANLEETVKVQQTVNKLRSATYTIIAADYVIAILNFII